MKFKMDVNLPFEIAVLLNKAGHNVAPVGQTISPKSSLPDSGL
jgi:hypothetical protein